jgi:hypothetical protein
MNNLADRAAVHDLFTRYCCALDNGDIETVVVSPQMLRSKAR